MRDVAAIVAPSVDVDRIGREIHAAQIALQDAERQADAAEKSASQKREEAAQRRLELGRLLCDARKAWPSRGPNAKGWGEFLLKVGIEQEAARRMMALSGYVEEISLSRTDERETVPTYAEVGIDKRPRKADVEEVDERAARAVGALSSAVESTEKALMAAKLKERDSRHTKPIAELIRKAIGLIRSSSSYNVPLVEIEKCLRDALEALKEMK